MRFAFANGLAALPALIAAHRLRAASAIAFRAAALRVRLRAVGADTSTAGADTLVTGGRPRRFVGPWRASMARFSLSRSVIRRATIWSVGIQRILAWGGRHGCRTAPARHSYSAAWPPQKAISIFLPRSKSSTRSGDRLDALNLPIAARMQAAVQIGVKQRGQRVRPRTSGCR